MALLNSYDSKLNKLVKVQEIILSIKKAMLGNDIPNRNKEVFYITEDMDVLPFQHPIYDADNECVYIDVRSYSSVDKQGNLVIRNTLDEQLMNLRADLELCWVRSDSKSDVWSAFSFSNKIFVNWLTDLIAYRIGLTPLNHIRLKALIAAYTLGLFYNGISENELVRQASLVARNLAIPADVLEEVLARIDGDIPRDIDELITAMEAVDLGPRARDFSVAALFNMLGGSWFVNSNASAIVALSLEYPPAFASLVKMAIDNSMFKRTGIGQKVDRENRQNNHQNFNRAVNLLIEKHTAE